MSAIELVKPRQIRELKHESPLHCCAFDPSGRFVFAGGRSSSLLCLDVATGSAYPLDGHETWISSLGRAGTDLVLSSDFAGHVIAWDCRGHSPLPLWKLEAHPNTIYSLAVSHDGKVFATGDRDGTIRIWQTSNADRVGEMTGLLHPVYGLAFHPDGKRLISADRQPQKPRIKVWEFATRKELLNVEVPELSAYRRVEDIEWGGIRELTLAPDGETVVACGSNGYAGPACALLFDINTGALKRKLTSTLKGYYYSARFHPRGLMITAGGDVAKGEFRIWTLDQNDSLLTETTPAPCTAVNIHPDGRHFAVTQTIGKGSYPDSGSLTLYEFAQ